VDHNNNAFIIRHLYQFICFPLKCTMLHFISSSVIFLTLPCFRSVSVPAFYALMSHKQTFYCISDSSITLNHFGTRLAMEESSRRSLILFLCHCTKTGVYQVNACRKIYMQNFLMFCLCRLSILKETKGPRPSENIRRPMDPLNDAHEKSLQSHYIRLQTRWSKKRAHVL
jgi:hypothetical protein